MSYFFSENPKGYETHIRFSTLLEVLVSISDYPIYSTIEFLQYNNFQDVVNAYYLEKVSFKAIKIDNGNEVVSELLHDIDTTKPFAVRLSRDLPKDISDRLHSIYLDPIELNQIDFIAKLDFDFTDKLKVDSITQHDLIMEQRLIEEELSVFVIKETLADKVKRPIKIPIENVIELVEHFNHKFIIKDNQLELVNHDMFKLDNAVFIPIEQNSKLKLIKNTDEATKEIEVTQEKTTLKNVTPYIELNDNQKKLITYDVFTPRQIVYLIAGPHPVLIDDDHSFVKHWPIVANALDSGLLVAYGDHMHIPAQQVKEWLASLDYIYEGFNDHLITDQAEQVKLLRKQLATAQDAVYELTNEVEYANSTIRQLNEENAKAQAETIKLKAQTDTPADSHKPLNLQLMNIKKAAVKHYNKSLAVALLDLDYRNYLSKNDIVSFIRPHMNALTLLLSDNDADKAKSLIVTDDTISKTHLKGLEFKTGRPSKKDGEKEKIELLFSRKPSDME